MSGNGIRQLRERFIVEVLSRLRAVWFYVAHTDGDGGGFCPPYHFRKKWRPGPCPDRPSLLPFNLPSPFCFRWLGYPRRIVTILTGADEGRASSASAGDFPPGRRKRVRLPRHAPISPDRNTAPKAGASACVCRPRPFEIFSEASPHRACSFAQAFLVEPVFRL